MLNCRLAQLSTFSVQQAATVNTKLGSPIYDHFIIPVARKVTKTVMGISHLQRIGIGLVFSIVAMAAAALVEVKRKRVASNSGLIDSTGQLPITFFWIAFSADLFTLAGLMEFFFGIIPLLGLFSHGYLVVNLNHNHFERFYWLMCVRTGLDFLHYISSGRESVLVQIHRIGQVTNYQST